MSSESLATLCLELATLGTLFVTLTLGSAALVVQGHQAARISARLAATNIVVKVQLALGSLPGDIRQLMITGVFDEETLANLARAWMPIDGEKGERPIIEEASAAFLRALDAARQQHAERADAIAAEHGASSTERYDHARLTLRWETTWLPLVQLLDEARTLTRTASRFEHAASSLRADSWWGTPIAVFLTFELAVAVASRVSVIGLGEMSLLNFLVSVVLILINGVLLIAGSRRLAQLVTVLTT